MGVEIERKFLVDKSWRPTTRGIVVRQGYLPQRGALLVRIRRQDERAFITLKGRTTGVTRAEYEYEIPAHDADELMRFCEEPIIDKTRYVETIGGHKWEIDVFAGANDGLVVAEIELQREDEEVARPSWLGDEVSGDARYYNSNLISHPYKDWK